jgi:hypothetical protein
VQPIFTLNARGHIMLEVMRDYFKMSNPRVRAEIQDIHRATQEALAAKGIKYADLKAALVPSADRHEAAFLFDSKAIESSWYGCEVIQQILPLLDERTTQSVLCGDLLGDDQRLIFEILEESLVLSRSFEFQHGTLLFCVYINNLSEAALRRLNEQLAAFPAYIGYIPTTFASRAKTYLSLILVNDFLKSGQRVIMGHEDDRPNDENVNMVGYPFEKFGYQVFSLQSSYFDIFLSFKIERAVYKGFEVDTEMAINAISDQVLPLQEFTVVLEEAKHDYLLTEKGRKLRKAGIAHLDRESIASLIKSKIAASYIYNLDYLREYNVIKFNLMIEVDRSDGGYPTQMTASLEYKPEEKVLRLLTLY